MFRESNQADGATQIAGSGSGSISLRPGSGSVLKRHGSATLYIQIKKCSESRIKRVARHKPFWHIRKLNKAQDEPLTEENKEFIQDFVDKKYSGPLKQVHVRSHWR
jgi:hypothetical protein